MALELMPDGVTFKKLNKTQEKALKRYYKRAQDKPLAETVGLPLLAGGVVITGAIGAIAYIFRDEIKTTFEEEKKQFSDWLFSLPKKAAVATGGGVADALVSLGDLIFSENPNTPPYVLLNPEDSPRDYRYAGPLTRCQRWENDGADWKTKDQAGEYLTKVGSALVADRIIKNMKKENCSKPTVFTQAQWDDI